MARLFYPATERNRNPILEVLKDILPPQGQVLEIASGSGEHVIHFATSFPDITWQPSDLETECRDSIQAWIDHSGLKNIHTPLQLDTTAQDWPDISLDAILCINMVHISPWEATLGLMEKAGKLLKPDGILYLYGPYQKNGTHTAPSNESFELWLKERDQRFGVRHMEEVEKTAKANGLRLETTLEMPANNFSLVFRRS